MTNDIEIEQRAKEYRSSVKEPLDKKRRGSRRYAYFDIEDVKSSLSNLKKRLKEEHKKRGNNYDIVINQLFLEELGSLGE